MEIMKIRLNMVVIKANYKGMKKNDGLCRACKEQEESTEHVIKCKEYKKITGHLLEWNEENMSDVNWLVKAVKVYKDIEIKGQQLEELC